MLFPVTDHTNTLFSVTLFHSLTASFNASFSVAPYIYLLPCLSSQYFLGCTPSYPLFSFNNFSQIMTCMHLGYNALLLAFLKLMSSSFSIQRTDKLIFLTCCESFSYPHHHMKVIVLHLPYIHCVGYDCFEIPISH